MSREDAYYQFYKNAPEEELASLGDTEKKSKMVESLHLLLNPEIHSQPDLGKREMVSDQGGLCGLASLYNALVSTIATTSMLRQLDYDTMRELMASEINIKRSKLPEYIDSALLTEFHECKKAWQLIKSEIQDETFHCIT